MARQAGWRSINIRVLWRGLVWLHWALVALVSLKILLILVSGGYRYRVAGLTIDAADPAPYVIALMVLVLAGYPLRGRHLRLRVFAPHEAVVSSALALIVYLANDSRVSGDTFPARYLPLSILREGNFDLDEFEFLREGRAYYVSRVGGRYVSNYPVGAALMALPLYIPSAIGPGAGASPFVMQIEKLAAAVIVALSVGLVFLIARRLSSPTLASVVTLVYALGTSSLSTSSQALW